ncbi:MAG TPA: bifunctional ADP-dependent NAD(P)H-hydrate dehydratase/NAD(P)H-hydrate epimerase [Dehalococcoidia bacterium]|nr:bifunctional ADP-dependent NAD(P)H-hydrate dehydratase/NAD(P)H-hydrate epimerase [Dehalococcoidia bacterium]
MKILNASRMRQADLECIQSGISADTLMENAGKQVALEVRKIPGEVFNKNIIVLAGPGNNGGDGLVAARYLDGWEAKVHLFLPGERSENDPNLKLVNQSRILVYKSIDQLGNLLRDADIVIDALFGTGSNRPIEGVYKEALAKVTEAKQKHYRFKVVAIDLPSGMNADSGYCDPSCLKADYTVTLGYPKIGLFTGKGPEKTGTVIVADIGIPDYMVRDVKLELLTGKWAKDALPERPLNANKGTFGKVLTVAGSVNYSGAAYLACSGAMRAGAGLVTLAVPVNLQPVLAGKLNEVTYLPLSESVKGVVSGEASFIVLSSLHEYTTLLIGCGLGQHDMTVSFTKGILFGNKPIMPLVIDADALNVLAKTNDWWQKLMMDAILTPHPGEMSRLTGIKIEEIQSNRIDTAMLFAQKWGKTVVLKGAYTVIASADGRCRVSPFANPGMASAGTGDVLAGIIAGLTAQGLDNFNAACLGVWLHGQAGEIVKAELGDTGMLAGDLLQVVPKAIKKLKES